MNKRIFLSCVTNEFEPHRLLLTKDLRRTGVELRVQEDFGVLGRTTLEKLDEYIRQCDAIIHLIGHATGACPELPAVQALLGCYPDLPAKLPILADALTQSDPGISYTQWEAYLAIYHQRDLYIYQSTDGAPRGAKFITDPLQQAAQAKHYNCICAHGRDRGQFETDERLSSIVLGDLRNILQPDPEPFIAESSKLWKLQTKPDSVFEGREKVLADLDALWADVLANKAGRAQIVSLVAIGGAGKTTVASRWKDALIAHDSHGGVERYFDWSFYSQGTRKEGDNASAQTAADATVFVAAALKFFGDATMADSPAPAWDKGARLAALVAQHRTLLILDGLEPLQHPPGPQQGELKDDALRALFAGLQSNGRGLCVVTTREAIQDLAAAENTMTPSWPLDHLTDVAGAAVLRGHKVIGPQTELEAASREVKGHALTLALMGRYLRLAFDPPDIAKRDCFHFSEADAETQNGHAFRVFATYENWFDPQPKTPCGKVARWLKLKFGEKKPPTEGQICVAILRLLGLFDRPATPDCLAALCAAPPIPGLTEPLVGLGEKYWNTALQRLRELDLIETAEWVPVKVSGYGEKDAQKAMRFYTDLGPPQPFETRYPPLVTRHSLDAHPLLREYFDAQLKESGIALAAHARLYEHLCASVPYWPEGRDGLLPLYQAVAHGCKAGRFQQVCDAVYQDRILRGTDSFHGFYSHRKLALFGLDLAAVACFFVEPWSRLVAEVGLGSQAWLLGIAAFGLRALNRLAEAREPIRAGREMRVQQKDWNNAARQTSILSELELTLGDVPAAETTAAQAITFADRSSMWEIRMMNRTTHADALHQAGRMEASRTLFAQAEAIQKENQPDLPLLYSLQGFRYCELVLTPAERVAWQRCAYFEPAEKTTRLSDLAAIERRAAQTLEWVTRYNLGLLDIALDHLTLGRVHLLRAVLQNKSLLEGRMHLDIGLAKLRQAGQNQYMPNTLLPCAWLHALVGEWPTARQRLDEAFAIATRGGNAQNGWQGGMRLHLVDTFLHRARLFGRLKDESKRMKGTSPPPAKYPWPGRTPAIDLAEAAALITACGYHRRDQELADAQQALMID